MDTGKSKGFQRSEIIDDTASRVIGFRLTYEKVYPWPNDQHCRWFAFTEMGEAMDAYMRSFDQYKRNNHKEHDVRGELADVAFMLISASQARTMAQWRRWSDPVQFPYGLPGLPTDSRGGVVKEAALIKLCQLFSGIVSGTDSHIPMVALGIIAGYPGIDLGNRVQGKLDRLVEKHNLDRKKEEKPSGQLFRSVVQLFRGR